MPCNKMSISKSFQCNKADCFCFPTGGKTCICISENDKGEIMKCDDCKCSNTGTCECKCDDSKCTCIVTKGADCVCVCRDGKGKIKACDCSCIRDEKESCCKKGANVKSCGCCKEVQGKQTCFNNCKCAKKDFTTTLSVGRHNNKTSSCCNNQNTGCCQNEMTLVGCYNNEAVKTACGGNCRCAEKSNFQASPRSKYVIKNYKCDKADCVCLPTGGKSCICVCENDNGDIMKCHDCKCSNSGTCQCKCDDSKCTCIVTKGADCICVCRDGKGNIKACNCSCIGDENENYRKKGVSDKSCGCCNEVQRKQTCGNNCKCSGKSNFQVSPCCKNVTKNYKCDKADCVCLPTGGKSCVCEKDSGDITKCEDCKCDNSKCTCTVTKGADCICICRDGKGNIKACDCSCIGDENESCCKKGANDKSCGCCKEVQGKQTCFNNCKCAKKDFTTTLSVGRHNNKTSSCCNNQNAGCCQKPTTLVGCCNNEAVKTACGGNCKCAEKSNFQASTRPKYVTKNFKCDKAHCVCLPTGGKSCICICENDNGELVKCDDCKCSNTGSCKCRCDDSKCTCIVTKGADCVCVCRDGRGNIQACDCSCTEYEDVGTDKKGVNYKSCGCCNDCDRKKYSKETRRPVAVTKNYKCEQDKCVCLPTGGKSCRCVYEDDSVAQCERCKCLQQNVNCGQNRACNTNNHVNGSCCSTKGEKASCLCSAKAIESPQPFNEKSCCCCRNDNINKVNNKQGCNCIEKINYKRFSNDGCDCIIKTTKSCVCFY